MWRRACLGSREDVSRLLTTVGAVVIGVLLLLAGTASWSVGFSTAASVAGGVLLLFRWRRRRWDRVVARQALECVREIEAVLRGRAGPSEPGTAA